MLDLVSNTFQRKMERELGLLAFWTTLIVWVSVLAFTGLVYGLAPLLGQSGTEFALGFLGASVGPMWLLQVNVLVALGLAAAVFFIPCPRWLTAPAARLAARLFSRLWDSAGSWPLATPGAHAVAHASGMSHSRLACWGPQEFGRSPHLPGDRPQLE